MATLRPFQSQKKNEMRKALIGLYATVANSMQRDIYPQGSRMSICESIQSNMEIEGKNLGLFLATELTPVTMDFNDFTEKAIKTGHNQYKQEMVNILIQVFCSLYIAQEKYDFTHYDLHAGNVLLTDKGFDFYKCILSEKDLFEEETVFLKNFKKNDFSESRVNSIINLDYMSGY